MKKIILISMTLFISSCSYFSGPEGIFPPTKDDFLKEKVEDDINLPSELNIKNKENHYPVNENLDKFENSDVPKPRQIFSSSGNSSVQLRRLGELMWIYVETLPSTSWPITKSYWETSDYEVINLDPMIGGIVINFDNSSNLKMKIEHGIKEASTEIFLLQVDKINNQSNINCNEKGEEFCQHVVSILSDTVLPDLKSNLVDQFFVTPDYFENEFNSFNGSGFGIQPIFRQSAYFRYSNKSQELNNLYFVGAGSHPGAGVPGVLSSAKVTEKLILKYNA